MKADLCDEGQDVAAREGGSSVAAQRTKVLRRGKCEGRGRTGGGGYLLKPVISRLGIPRKFSTLVLTSSAKPPETNQTEAVRREGAGTGHHAPTSRPSGKGGKPSGPGGLLARLAGHVPSQGEICCFS